MDPFSLASGIAGLMSLSIELIKLVGGYVDGVKGCPKSVKDISEKLETLNLVLNQLTDFLGTENLKGDSFDKTSTLCFATNACKGKLQSIFDNLEKYSQGGRLSKCVEKLKWPFTEAENLKTIETLHGYIQTFQFSLTIEGCALLSKTSDEVSKTLAKQVKTHDIVTEASEQISAVLKTIATFSDVSEELAVISHTVVAMGAGFQNSERQKIAEEMQKHRKKVLEWLSPLAFKDRHLAISALRQPDTGLWFLGTKEFKEWLEGDTNPVLWCPGIPGAGKSVMVSSVVDHLAKIYSAQNMGLAYLYCDYKDTNIQTSVNLFSSFTWQLAGKMPALPSEIEDFYKSHGSDNSPQPTVKDHLTLLSSLSRKFTKTFLIVDALDEALNNDGFLDWKLLLSTVQEAGSSIRLLVTSRFQDGIEQIFRTSSRVEIRASAEDVRKFLLARFQLDRLGDQTSTRNVRRALVNMPEKLTDTYNDTLSRIRAQCKERAELAIRVLSWIYHARRPLKAEELRHALAVEPGDNHLHEDGLQSVGLLLGVCGGLVTLDEESDTIRLVHYTIQEYLNDIRDQLFSEPEIDIARTCLTYLLFPAFVGTFGDRCRGFHRGFRRGFPFSGILRGRIIATKNPFFLYSSQNWTHHLRGKSESKLLDLSLKYVKHQGKTTTTEWSHPAVHLVSGTRGFTPLHFAAGVGLESVVRVLVGEGAAIDALDSNSESPLFWALRNGHDSIFQFLVDKGASTWVLSEDCKVRNIETGLAWWKQSDLPAAKRLCKRGLDNSLGPQQNVLLHPFVLAQALEGGKEAVMKMLLDKGLDKDEVVIPCVFPATIKHRSDHLVCLDLAGVIEIDIDTKMDTRFIWLGDTPTIRINAVILKDLPSALQKFTDTVIRKRQGDTAISLANKQQRVEDATPPPGRTPCAEKKPTSVTSPNTTPNNPPTKQPCTTEGTMLPDMPQGSNTTVPRGKPNQGQLSRSLIRTHYVSLILGFFFLICFFLFLNLGQVSFLYNIYFSF